MTVLIFITAIALSSVAAFYSIVGLTAIFAAALIPIIIMASILEVSKLIVTVWLHEYWDRCKFVMKLYLVSAVVLLMFITSMGIFGFLSKAHIEQTSAAKEQQAQLSRFDDEVLRYQDIIARAEQRIAKGESDADKQDVGIQDKIDREQERIDSAYTRRQPSIDEQQSIIDAEQTAQANRIAVYQDEIESLDAELDRLNQLVEEYRSELAGASVASVEKQIEPYRNQIAQLDADLERINTQANEYETRISSVEADTGAVDPILEQITAIEETIVVTTNKLQSTERDKIREGQATIGVTSDGLFGSNTRRALATWVEAQQSRIQQLQAQEVELRTRAQDAVDTERARLTDLVKDLRGAQTERINQRKQALLDTIDRIRADAASGLEGQRAGIQSKIDSVLNTDIPANRQARRTAQATINELGNQDNAKIETARAEIVRIRALAEDEIANAQAVIERLRAEIQVGDNVDLDELIDEQNKRIKDANNEIDRIIEEKFTLESEVRKLEAEVGPVKYIAEIIYGETSEDILEKAVRWVILILVGVFDPLAVMMLLAATESRKWYREKQNTKSTHQRQKYEQVRAQAIINNPGHETKQQEPTVTEPESESTKKKIAESIVIDDDEDDEDEGTVLRQAKAIWKHENPGNTLKEQRRKLALGQIDELPWLKLVDDPRINHER